MNSRKVEIEGYFFLHCGCNYCGQSIIVYRNNKPPHLTNGKITYYLSDILSTEFGLDGDMSDEAFKKLRVTIEEIK